MFAGLSTDNFGNEKIIVNGTGLKKIYIIVLEKHKSNYYNSIQ